MKLVLAFVLGFVLATATRSPIRINSAYRIVWESRISMGICDRESPKPLLCNEHRFLLVAPDDIRENRENLQEGTR